MTGTCKRSGGSLSPGGPTWSFGGRKRRGGGTPHAAGGMFGGSRKRTCRRGGWNWALTPQSGGGSSNFAGETNPKYGGGGVAGRMIGGKRSGKRSGKRTCRRGGGQSGPSIVGNMF
jgi:hypothetical protein